MADEILITGRSGLLGRYVARQFEGSNISSLGKSRENTFVCDLSVNKPSFNGKKFTTVIHCAGTSSENDAMAVNYDGSLNLLAALEENVPENFIFISSYEVYSADAGEGVDENRPLWATSKVGQSKALAEKKIEEWCSERGVTLTIVRPAILFGTGVKGRMLNLFNDAVSGRYIHIRGNDARLSVVTALDVARFIKRIHTTGGTFNVADGFNPKLIDLVEAMTENHGARKRPVTLPPKWASVIWKFGRFIPLVDSQLNPSILKRRSTTLTLDNSRATATGMSFHNTIEVIARRDNTYPYESI